MRPKMFPFLALVALFGVIFISNSCGSSPASCPVCGTDKHATVGLIDVMLVPEHNGTGEPGGPFNIFDISWVDPVNRLYYVSDRVGLDVPMFSTITNIALCGDRRGQLHRRGREQRQHLHRFDAFTAIRIIPPITTAQGNYTRFGCKTMGFRLPGFLRRQWSFWRVRRRAMLRFPLQ